MQILSCLWLAAGVRPPDLNYQRGDRRVELSHAVLQDDLQFTRANSTSKSSLFGLLHSSVLQSIAEQAIITLHPYSWRSLLIPSSAGSFVAQRESLLYGIREGAKEPLHIVTSPVSIHQQSLGAPGRKRFLVEKFQEVGPNSLILSSSALTMRQESNVDGVLREAYGFEATGNSIHA